MSTLRFLERYIKVKTQPCNVSLTAGTRDSTRGDLLRFMKGNCLLVSRWSDILETGEVPTLQRTAHGLPNYYMWGTHLFCWVERGGRIPQLKIHPNKNWEEELVKPCSLEGFSLAITNIVHMDYSHYRQSHRRWRVAKTIMKN